MPKRAFQRERSTLIDHYVDPGGRETTAHITEAAAGVKLSNEARRSRLSEMADEDGRSVSTNALWDDHSPEFLDALLNSLAELDISAPMALVQFLDDPRVRPALLEATRRAEPEQVANFAQVLGITGGPGVLQLLGEWRERLVNDPTILVEQPFVNWRAGGLRSVAEAELKLDPDSAPAAAAIILMMGTQERTTGTPR